MARERLKKVITPPGIASYPHLAQPDTYKGKTEYKTSLVLDPSDDGVQDFMDKVSAACQEKYDSAIKEWTEQLDAAKGKKKADLKKAIAELEVHLPWGPEFDDEGDETGRIVVKFKALAEGVYKSGPKEGKTWKRELPIFDSQRQPLDSDELRLWGGSTIRVQAEMNPYAMGSTNLAGVSLRLFSVQVIELSNGGGDAADGFGVEDGYVGETSSPKKPSGGDDFDDDQADDEDEDF